MSRHGRCARVKFRRQGQAETPAPPQHRKQLQGPGLASAFACQISSHLPVNRNKPMKSRTKIFAIAALALAAFGQQAPVVFKSSTSLVVLDVTVKDHSGKEIA